MMHYSISWAVKFSKVAFEALLLNIMLQIWIIIIGYTCGVILKITRLHANFTLTIFNNIFSSFPTKCGSDFSGYSLIHYEELEKLNRSNEITPKSISNHF